MLRHSILFTFLLFYFSCSLTAQVKILFDATKAESAANADWVIDADKYNVGFGTGVATIGGSGTEANPQRFPTPAQSGITTSTPENYWSGGLSAWAIECVKKGYLVETLPIGGKITFADSGNSQDLSNYQILVLCEPNIAFTLAEKTAIIRFIENGGGLFLVGNHDMSDRNFDGIDSPAILNDLMNNNSIQSNPFGFNYNMANISQTSTNVISTTNHPILNGSFGNVTKIKTSAGNTITINPVVNPKTEGLFYKNGTQKLKNEVLATASQYAKGRVFAIADSSLPDDGTGDTGDTLYDGWLGDAEGNHRKLIMNATVWLASTPIDSIKATVKSTIHNSCSDSKNGSVELSVTGGNKIYAYLWSNGATTNPAGSLSAGSYNVTISSTGAPTLFLKSIVVTAPAALSVAVGPHLTLTCKTPEVTLAPNASGGTPPYVFLWSSGAAKIKSPGTYSVSVSDNNACQTTAQTTVKQDINLPVVLVQYSNITCLNPRSQLGASSASQNLRYEWKGPNNFISNKKDTAVNIPGIYTLSVKDTLNGCGFEKTVSIIENSGNLPLEVKLLDKRNASDIPSGFISIEVSNGTPPYQYQWKNEAGKIVGTNSASITNIDNGTFTCEITDANGCKISISQEIDKILNTIDPAIKYLFQVMPNPVADYLSVDAGETFLLDVISLEGKIITSGKTNERLDIEGFPSGLYLIKIYSPIPATRFFIKI
ncbi:MAG: T9SS type A sorting domain-containing protein [Saprospiraceae bacterium]